MVKSFFLPVRRGEYFGSVGGVFLPSDRSFGRAPGRCFGGSPGRSFGSAPGRSFGSVLGTVLCLHYVREVGPIRLSRRNVLLGEKGAHEDVSLTCEFALDVRSMRKHGVYN